MMASPTDHSDDARRPDVEFFGVRLKVSNPRLADLLNSSVHENVVVIGRRTADLLARADDEESEEAETTPLGVTDPD